MTLPLNLLHFRIPTYDRKQQSLGLLCSSFLSLYDQDGVKTIELDAAAARLGVVKRRICEIVNILGGIGLLTKKSKKHYSWRGFGVLPRALQLLKEEGLKESYTSFEDISLKDHDDDKEDNLCSSSKRKKSTGRSVSKLSGSEPVKSAESGKEKCLGLLTQNFVKLFLCYDVDIVALDEAREILLGDVDDQSVIRKNPSVKLRRLYDIANVLSSMNLIEKTDHPWTRKPAFRWIGMREKPQITNDRVLDDSKKRAFVTELTNIRIRRRRVAPSSNATTDEITATPSETRTECRTSKKLVDESDLQKGSMINVRKFDFGPFTPIYVPIEKPKGNNEGAQIPDWESLAITHSPQYQNQALRDLFGHYMGAYNYFCSEVAGKDAV